MKSKVIKNHISTEDYSGGSILWVSRLLKWYEIAKRELPWRQTKEPYNIWVSEILLQQTRVAQATPYYYRFLSAFPSLPHLATSSEERVLKVWEGLGYYSRARNMHACAKEIEDKYGGKFPDNFQELLSLPGVGPYTAAAIGSICFGTAEPAIDGNIFRVYSRFFGIEEDISKQKTRKLFEQLLRPIIPKNNPGEFNQAGMELGATICTPSNPQCNICPIEGMCIARHKNLQDKLPVKNKKEPLKERLLTYNVHFHGDRLLLRQRKERDIWLGLYEFTPTENSNGTIKEKKEEYGISTKIQITHLLSHQRINLIFKKIEVETEEEFKEIANIYDMKLYNRQEWVNLPFPVPFIQVLEQFYKENK